MLPAGAGDDCGSRRVRRVADGALWAQIDIVARGRRRRRRSLASAGSVGRGPSCSWAATALPVAKEAGPVALTRQPRFPLWIGDVSRRGTVALAIAGQGAGGEPNSARLMLPAGAGDDRGSRR